METALLLIALAVTVLTTTALSERVGVPAPLLLIAMGVTASYLPFVPVIHLSPEVVLIGLLPPLLYAAAIQTSLVDFAANRNSILLLSVALVVATTLVVGVVVQLLLPELGWPAAFAIGAVVAPPDAVAATAIAKRIGLPRDVVTILEGESLLNDASALVALRTALAAMLGAFSFSHVATDFLRAAGGGLLIGLVLFFVVAWLRRHVRDPLMDTAISFVTPFVAYVAAEEVHASGVIAVVVAGLLLGHKAPILQTAQSRLTEAITWRTVAFLLENAVFLLIGLQARWILADVVDSPLGKGTVAAVCLATLVTVIVVRLAWVVASRALLVVPGTYRRRERVTPPWSHSLLIGWAGMRGVVTLAAAFIIPEDTPYRNVLLLIAFTVVAGTLFLQGLTLPALTRRLRVSPPDPAEDALARATLLQQAAHAGMERLETHTDDDPHGVLDVIRARVDQATFAAWERLGTVAGEETPSQRYARIRLDMIGAERARVLDVRKEGRVPSDVVREVLATLDLEESMIHAGNDARDEISSTTASLSGPACEDLVATPALAAEPSAEGGEGAPVCEGCIADGTRPVALRRCLACGHVGCCDSSVGRHATAHFEETGHPVMQSAEPGEVWRWCYVHQATA